MLTLYHAGKQEIPRPDVHFGRKNADFGQGFYLTPDREFACRWAGEGAVLNEYELDETGLLIHTFQRDEAWFDYIFNNRRARDGLGADVVAGPVANDTIYDTFGILTSGFLSREEALRLLLIGPEYRQVALKTERAAERLKWVSARRMTRAEYERYHELLAEENRAYQALLAAKMWSMAEG
ncbi:MAG: DUF3990 domain-containing protein [Clostridia bacterium]|nr:DUF3990 domain-containing protein [Clostridia bacterium]